MSVASQWKLKELKEKEAAAAAAISKTGIPGAKGKTGASPKDALGEGAVGGVVGGQVEFKNQIEKSGKLEAVKPGAPLSTSFGKQGASKLPVGKDNQLKTVQTRETEAVPTKDGAVQAVGATPGSKIPVGAKENTAIVGGRKPFGYTLKKEELPIKPKTEDKKVKATEVIKEPTGGAKDSTPAAAPAAPGDDGPLGPGRTKGLAGFWANQNDEVKTVKKKRLTAVEENLAPIVVENTPQQLEGVVRAHDPGEWKKPHQVEDGRTKNVVNSFQKRQQESFSRRAPISLVEDTSSEAVLPDAEVKVKDISQRLTRQQSEPTKQVKEKLVIDRSQGAIVLAENQPMEVDPDVIRSDDASKDEVVLEKGRTRNLLQLWKDTEVEYNAPKTSTHRYQGSKPAWILEIEAAKGNSIERNDDSEENNEINDEGGKSDTSYKEEHPMAEATLHADVDKQNIALDTKAFVPPSTELGEAGVLIKPRNDGTNVIKLDENVGTTKKEIQHVEASATESVVVKLAEVQPSPPPNKIETIQKPLTTHLDRGILTDEIHVEQSSEAPFDERHRTPEVCYSKPAKEDDQLDGTEASKVAPEETKSTVSDVLSNVPSSIPDQDKTLQAIIECDVENTSPLELEPIHKAGQNELVSKEQTLLFESWGTTPDKHEPIEQVGQHEGSHPTPSTELKPSVFADPSRSNTAPFNLTGVGRNDNESEAGFGRTGVAISAAQDVSPMQRFLDNIGKPEEAQDEAVKSQRETQPAYEENKVTMMTEDHEESSDHEVFATPTKSVILPPLGPSASATQVESCVAEMARGRAEGESEHPNEGTLIDLQTESIDTRREKLSLFSLDDLLQLETSPNVEYRSADSTPCLVPLSSPSTPEHNISSQRSSGVFDSDSEKGSVWFSPQEETTSASAKTETIISTTNDDHSPGSLNSKAGDENITESKTEQTNKADAPQRSCRVM